MGGVVQNRSKIAVSCFVLFCAALALTSYSSKNPDLSRAGALMVAEMLRPFQKLLKGTSKWVTGLWDGYIDLVRVRREQRSLVERVRALEVENSKLFEWREEVKRLRSLLGIAQESGLQGIAADVIGYDPTNWVQAVTVDKGSEDGIKPGLPVIKENAVVGQVMAVSPHSSRVLLIVDHTSGVDGIVQSNRVRGIIEGAGKDVCELRYVPREEEITVGDRIITSGVDGVYPKGLMVGVVSDVDRGVSGMFWAIRVKPAVRFSRLETVLIVTPAQDKITSSAQAVESSEERAPDGKS